MEREEEKEIGNGYKIIYSGKTSTKNGVGVVKDEEMKNKIVDVVRKGDRLIVVKLIFEEKFLSKVSAYAPQAECEEKDKKVF